MADPLAIHKRSISDALEYLLNSEDGRRIGTMGQHFAFMTLLQTRIAALPEQNPTKSRDYGRGYAQAIRDVQELLK